MIVKKQTIINALVRLLLVVLCGLLAAAFSELNWKALVIVFGAVYVFGSIWDIRFNQVKERK